VNAWEIWTFDSGHGDHPAVIISHQERATRKPLVEVLLCSSQRAARPPEGNEVLLDSADGLNWETLCKCDLIYSVQRSLLHTKRGQVVQERRPQIVRTMISSHGWNTL
jgi:mRNA-degrading endonuclease toxin of MazEF toxin-antitoxin module